MKRWGAVLGSVLVCTVAFGAVGCEPLDVATTVPESGTITTPAGVTSATTVVPTGLPTRWTKYDLPQEPDSNIAQSMVYDPVIGKMVVFGGSMGGDDASYTSELWFYDSSANNWTGVGVPGAPPGRAGHSMVYVPTIGKTLVFGGETPDEDVGEGYYQVTSDLWAYDSSANTWTELRPAGKKPSARSDHAMVFDPATGKVILFGGYDDQWEPLSDLWAYDPVANTWALLQPKDSTPPARSDHVMAYHPGVGKIVLYGGLISEDYSVMPEVIKMLDDTWAYDTVANTWTKLEPSRVPGYHRGAEMVYHPGSGLMILFGGMGKGEFDYPQTLWAYDAGANTWTKLSPAGRFPYGRVSLSMAYDPVTGKIVMYGGCDYEHSGEGGFNGTWTLTP